MAEVRTSGWTAAFIEALADAEQQASTEELKTLAPGFARFNLQPKTFITCCSWYAPPGRRWANKDSRLQKSMRRTDRVCPVRVPGSNRIDSPSGEEGGRNGYQSLHSD